LRAYTVSVAVALLALSLLSRTRRLDGKKHQDSPSPAPRRTASTTAASHLSPATAAFDKDPTSLKLDVDIYFKLPFL